MTTHETLLILDFGSQYTQLIARRVRELGVRTEIRRGDLAAAVAGKSAPIGIVLSGGPSSIYEEGAISPDPGIFGLGVPVLGVCYGQQAMAHLLGGEVAAAGEREHGGAELEVDLACSLFAGTPAAQRVWMSRLCIRKPSARVDSRWRASAFSVAMGSSLRLPLVITRGGKSKTIGDWSGSAKSR